MMIKHWKEIKWCWGISSEVGAEGCGGGSFWKSVIFRNNVLVIISSLCW